jgi:hypothetical protein
MANEIIEQLELIARKLQHGRGGSIISKAAEVIKANDSVNDELMGIIAEQAYEIHRLKKIIRDYYAEECLYNNQISDRINPDFAVPQTWKDAYTAFENEAFNIDLEGHDY